MHLKAAIVILASFALVSGASARTLYQDDRISVRWVDDATTLSQTMMAGLKSDTGDGVLLAYCTAEGHFLGGLMIAGTDTATLGNTITLVNEAEMSFSFRGRTLNFDGRMRFDTNASGGLLFLPDIDHLRMARPATLGFLGKIYAAKSVVLTAPNGTSGTAHRFSLKDFKPWMERVAGECGRKLDNG